MVEDFPETPLQTRDNTDFPGRLRKREASMRVACPPSPGVTARRTGGEKVVRADPPFLAAGVPRGRAKGDRDRDTLCPPLRGRSLSPH